VVLVPSPYSHGRPAFGRRRFRLAHSQGNEISGSVKPQHPIADRLEAEAADAAGIAARATVTNLGNRQEPASEGGICRQAKLRASEVSAKGDRGCYGESPSFVMVNHTNRQFENPA
jgi:hypothetical protein